jgi:hypothetical protein
MIAQTSASALLTYNDPGEKELSCLFLFDAVAAFRSDLTFFMAVRGWLMTNYDEFISNERLRGRPLFSGFVLLSTRQKRFLAHLASNPDAELGGHPGLPDFFTEAIKSCQFSATLLIEPGLLHYELGWPNMLRWHMNVGPLLVDLRGGFIFRLTGEDMAIGISVLARGSLDIGAELDLGFFGVRAHAHADVAFGARFIGVLDFGDPLSLVGAALGHGDFYAALGIEINVTLSIEAWIHIELFLTSIDLDFSFSIGIGFTAGVEVGHHSLLPGLRGEGTISLSVCGHDVQLSVRLSANEDAVEAALNRTQKYLNMGLEATEVEKIPGMDAGAPGAPPAGPAPPPAGLALLPVAPAPPPAGPAPPPAAPAPLPDAPRSFVPPDYNLFIMRRKASDDDFNYMVLFPQAAAADAKGKTGFLPVPPDPDAEGNVPDRTDDFELTLPKLPGLTLQQFKNGGRFEDVTGSNGSLTAKSGTVKWGKPYRKVGKSYRQDGQTTKPPPDTISFAQYLTGAFIISQNPKVLPISDPDPLPVSHEDVHDERVQNPSDTAFEAAVKGAVEQFEGSPMFKKDPANVRYDQLLDDAFKSTTTIYTASGKTEPLASNGALSEEGKNRQAHQTRGMIVHDLIADVRKYAEASAEEQAALLGTFVPTSIPFQLGLVFRFKGADLPDDFGGKIRQRISPTDGTLSDLPDHNNVRIYNLASADFSRNPPTFRNVQHYTDANTIAIAWEIAWDGSLPDKNGAPRQDDPEHHLMHYRVLRRGIGTGESDVLTTVKPSEVLHREGDVLRRLQPRFQIVDHFNKETLDDQAALPPEGRTYLYTIMPVDFSGNVGRPITVRATRRPSEPPLVPVTGELFVDYELEDGDFEPRVLDGSAVPVLVEPTKVRVRWAEQPPPTRRPVVAIDHYMLIFRRDPTAPIGSYGLDSTTQGPRHKSLPTSNARPLRTDIQIPIAGTRSPLTGDPSINEFEIKLPDLEEAGVLPKAEGAGATKARRWQPESWRVYLQAISGSGVPSTLTPVQIKLHVTRKKGETTEFEQRAPAELEWLPYPAKETFLPAEDSNARTGIAHVPTPKTEVPAPHKPFVFSANPEIGFRPHPDVLRCIEFRWNQGASSLPRKLLDLNAGYRFFELDVDDHTAETFDSNATTLTDALRLIQEIEMAPAEDLALTPHDTTNPSQWEAWYPSRLLRLPEPGSKVVVGSESTLGPWYSWRDSILIWPEWPGLTDDSHTRADPLHVVLQEFLVALRDNPAQKPGLAQFQVDPQFCPPTQQANLTGFMTSTAPKSDPYGWGVLQRLGLNVAFSLRTNDGEIVIGQALLDALAGVWNAYKDEPILFNFSSALTAKLNADAEIPTALGEDLAGVANALTLLNGAQVAGRAQLTAALRKSIGTALLTKVVKADGQTLGSFLFANIDRVKGPDGKPLSFASFQPHVFFEMLVQPGRSIALAPDDFAPDGLLATVQISLRPFAKQTLFYNKVTVTATNVATGETAGAGAAVTLTLTNTPAAPISIIEVTARDGPENSGKAAQVVQRELVSDADKHILLKLPPTGEAVFLIRSLIAPTATAELVKADQTVKLTVKSEVLKPTEEFAANFTITPEMLGASFASASSLDATQWERLRHYLEALNGNDPSVTAAAKIDVPLGDAKKIEPVLPQFLAWSQRFFDAGVAEPSSTDGPWLATAYPRAVSPMVAAPDDFGRLTYHHLLADDWAHNYRYPIRVQRRYDLLWNSLRQSRVLFGDQTKKLEPPLLDPNAGGLDVVLDRAHSVAMPLVLRSGRLDAESEEGKPTAPGTTWEVIVARHPEQALIERNQTLVRRLSFRHVAFTLLRSVANPKWPEDLGKITEPSAVIDVLPVVNTVADAPDAYPAKPEHVDFAAADLSDESIRGFDLPRRIEAFSQGALVLQWRALPFFYKHRLLLIAQSASTVSPVNQIVQSDFEYRAPAPAGTFDTHGFDLRAAAVVFRELRIPLRRFWDSLPDEAQAEWTDDEPAPPDSAEKRRKFSSLPDPEVVYQIVELIDGNIEVQIEFFYDVTPKKYAGRQLGKHFTLDAGSLRLLAPGQPQGDFILTATVAQALIPSATSREFISRPVDEPNQFLGRIRYEETTDCGLVWNGAISAAEKTALLNLRGDTLFTDAVAKLIADAKTGTLTTKTAPAGPDQVPASIAHTNKLTFKLNAANDAFTALIWTGTLEPDEEQVLRTWAKIPEFAAAVETLIAQMTGLVIAVSAATALPPPPVSTDLALHLQFASDGHDTQVTWRGRANDGLLSELRAITTPLELQTAVQTIITRLEDAKTTVLLDLPRRPEMGELDGALKDKLLIGRAFVGATRPLSADDSRDIQTHFPLQPDKDAIERLYRDLVRESLHGSDLRIRARRGNAPVSELIPLEIAPL